MRGSQLVVALLAVTAAADSLDRRALSENCYTSFASTRTKSVPTVSHTVTYTLLWTKTKFVHPTTAVTPPAVSSTLVETNEVIIITTATAVTDTATVTSTTTSTDTSTAPTTTLTTTITDLASTSTVVTTTTTEAAISGFTPIQSSLPNSNNNQKREFIARRMARARLGKRSQLSISAQPRYPKRVKCNVFETVTETVKTTYTGGSAVTRSASTPTVTDTKTITLTTISSILPPDVTDTFTDMKTASTVVTITPSVTETASTTITDTATQTATVTFYAQCVSANFADQGPNGKLSDPVLQSGTTVVETTAPDAYSCCVACAQDAACSFGALVSDTECSLAEETTCNAQTTHFYAIQEITSSSAGIQFFNGNCGQISEYDS